jgi:hypothetical protein
MSKRYADVNGTIVKVYQKIKSCHTSFRYPYYFIS